MILCDVTLTRKYLVHTEVSPDTEIRSYYSEYSRFRKFIYMWQESTLISAIVVCLCKERLKVFRKVFSLSLIPPKLRQKQKVSYRL